MTLSLMYTNCQRGLIFEFLKLSNEFMKEFKVELDKVPHNHTAIKEGIKISDNILKDAKLFIYQPLDDKYGELSTNSILSRLPSECICISLPRLYFKGYWPQHGANPYSKITGDIQSLFSYGDTNLNQMIEEGVPKEEIIQRINKLDFYNHEDLIDNLEYTLNEISKREEYTDVKISEFIRQNYKNYRLFHTINHPTDMVGREVANQILQILNMPKLSENVLPFHKEVLGGLQVPIYPSVREKLGLNFITPNEVYSLKGLGRKLTFSEYAELYIDQDQKYRKSELLFKSQPNEILDNLSDKKENQQAGVIYIITGTNLRYVHECIFSAASLKKYCPKLPIAVLSDKFLDFPKDYFDYIIPIQTELQPLQVKVEFMYKSPFDKTLFLDTDTQVLQPIDEMFNWLDEYDLCVANGPMWAKDKPQELLAYEGEGNYNTGVLLYRKSDKVELFFNTWLEKMLASSTLDKDYYNNPGVNDQFFFNQLIFQRFCEQHGIKRKIFTNTVYNVRSNMIQNLKNDGKIKDVKILHMHDLHKKKLKFDC
ncbi:nucleotide-diphospho-sugar transferase family protein [Lyngbya aestuarii BL J]|uniref:Nucleotide-diphospho-sugar transferase family protein n=1 Tax=Lyngbya aestuarii BL J TaxID=1348334 RepID=U7Q8X3_9CYAN|nr:WcbI family polysaccharide biosynthesis putative acetyltransferase [Lyngbya aestuarii]ERT04243.1 nucleotide-diphospho-sugar transferase family protein [Lyngbya aestuarii BL J]